MDALPPETMGNVFFHSIPTDTAPFTPPSNIHAPLSLTHVSSRWRTVAQSIPLLWTGRRISPVENSDQSNLVLIKEWLARSQDLPISIALYLGADYWQTRALDLNPATFDMQNFDPASLNPTWTEENLRRTICAISAVLNHSDRLESLSICLDTTCLEAQEWTVAEGRLGRLKHLELMDYKQKSQAAISQQYLPIPHTVSTSPAPAATAVLSCAQHLRHFRGVFTSRNAVLFQHIQGSINWRQLTSVDATITHQSQYTHILRACTNLSDLSVGFWFEDFGPPIDY